MGLLLFTPWQSQINGEQQEKNKQQGINRQRVKMGQRVKIDFCSLPPDRVKLAVNSKENKQQGQDGLLLFTPLKSQNVLLLFTPWQSKTNWTARKKDRVGSNCAKRSQVGPGPFWLGDNRVKLGQKESSWAWVNLGQAHFDSESNRAKESRWVGTVRLWILLRNFLIVFVFPSCVRFSWFRYRIKAPNDWSLILVLK